MQTANDFLNKFRSDLFDKTGVKLDFRSHQFISNHHGNSPVFSYDDGSAVIAFLYEWGHEFIEDNKVNYPNFSGWEYNLQMSIEVLRTCKLKDIIESKCFDLSNNFIDQY